MGPLWAYDNCFGGPTKGVAPWNIELNNEPKNLVNVLVNNFKNNVTVNKIIFESPYDEVIDRATPHHFPLVRIPTTGST